MLESRAKPLALPRLSRDETALAQRLGAKRAPLPFPGNRGFALRLRPPESETDAPPPPGLDPIGVAASFAGKPFHASVPRRLVHDLIRGLGNTIEPEKLPPDLAGLLLEASILNLLNVWEQVSGVSVTLDAAGLPPPQSGLALQLDGPDRSWPIRLQADDALLDRMLRSWPLAARDLDFLPIPVRLRAGLTRLGIRLVESLRPGDVVLLEVRSAQPSSAMLVAAETFAARIVLQGTQWQLAEPPIRAQEEWTMSGAEPEEEGGLDDLPVRLAFDLGHIDIPLSELRQLDAGSVLELGRAMTEFVEISANGRRIGRGELVDVDGSLGVRIMRIFNRADLQS